MRASCHAAAAADGLANTYFANLAYPETPKTVLPSAALATSHSRGRPRRPRGGRPAPHAHLHGARSRPTRRHPGAQARPALGLPARRDRSSRAHSAQPQPSRRSTSTSCPQRRRRGAAAVQAVPPCGTRCRTMATAATVRLTRPGLFAGQTRSGANRDRTGDLLLAKQALSQLSYGPAATECSRGPTHPDHPHARPPTSPRARREHRERPVPSTRRSRIRMMRLHGPRTDRPLRAGRDGPPGGCRGA